MRTKRYTKAQLTAKAKNRKPIVSNNIYNNADDDVLYILDKNFKPLGIDYCREFTCDSIGFQIRNGKLPAYIGICLVENVKSYIHKPKGKTVKQLKTDLREGKLKVKEIERAEGRLVSRALKMSNSITALEKKFKFKTHTLRCLSHKKNPDIDVYEQNWGPWKGKININIEVVQIWTFKLDNQWLSSPPVTSYVLLCMREFASKKKKKGGKLLTRRMHTLLSKNKPHVLFGKNRKVNWGMVSKNREVFGGYFDDSYGVDAFEHQYRRRAKVALRAKFPNNRLFK